LAHLAELWTSDLGRTVFRYLGAPPISTDDLETLAEARLGAAAFDKGGEAANRLLDVMRAIVDPRRFPWLDERRTATESERRAARLATAVLVASQRVQTLRRGDEKAAVEGAVKGLLIGMGWRPAEQRPVQGVQRLLTDSPPSRSFLTQCNLGADNADLIVRLDDDRLLAIECKGSNSEINSRKRLNKEAVQNARAWTGHFGSQIVAAVALQGVFKARYLEEAQDTPMAIYWSHRLEDLKEFVAKAR
jgi:Holliday junction resolvase